MPHALASHCGLRSRLLVLDLRRQLLVSADLWFGPTDPLPFPADSSLLCIELVICDNAGGPALRAVSCWSGCVDLGFSCWQGCPNCWVVGSLNCSCDC